MSYEIKLSKWIYNTIPIAITLCLMLAACSNPEPVEIIEVSPRFVFTPTATVKSEPTITATKTPVTGTSTLKPSSTPVKVETSTLESSPTPTLTPTVVFPPLTIRQPTITELENYLAELSLKEEYHGYVIEVLYEDVNGDGVTDLVVSDYLFVGIFIWQGDQYIPLFINQRYAWKYDPGSRVTLEDWTNDGIPEVVFDFREDTGGTGVRITYWTRDVIHCPETEASCHIVWTGELGSYSEYASGIALTRVEADQIVSSSGTPSIEVLTESFAVNPFDAPLFAPRVGNGIFSFDATETTREGFAEQYYLLDSLKIFTTTLESYNWNGDTFEVQDKQIIQSYQEIASQVVLEATSQSGQIASISTQFNNSAEGENDICQLYVDNNAVGAPFGCKRNFTVVSWQDITSDGNEELVISALSGLYGAEENLPDKDCFHQRLLAYQQESTQFTEIANITGCVVQSNLYGVKIEDIDSDGQVEILAAGGEFTAPRCFSAILSVGSESQENCWYELGHQDEIYEWNGDEFVLSNTPVQ